MFAALVSVMAPPPEIELNVASFVILLMRMKPGLSAESVTRPDDEKAPVKSILPSEPVVVVIETVPAELKLVVPVTLPATSIATPPLPALTALSSVLPVAFRAIPPEAPEVTATPAEKTLAVLDAVMLPPADSDASVFDSTEPVKEIFSTADAVRLPDSMRTDLPDARLMLPVDVGVVPPATNVGVPSGNLPASSTSEPDRPRILALIAIFLAARSVSLFSDNQLTALATVISPSCVPVVPVVTITLPASSAATKADTARTELSPVASVPVTLELLEVDEIVRL